MKKQNTSPTNKQQKQDLYKIFYLNGKVFYLNEELHVLVQDFLTSIAPLAQSDPDLHWYNMRRLFRILSD